MRTRKICFEKKCALGVVGLIVAILCITLSLRVSAAEENAIPQSASAKLYMEMSDNSGVIANLIVGNEFEIVSELLDDNGSRWYKVRTDFGAEGYAKAGELDELIIDAHEMLYSAAIASANAAQTPEENPVDVGGGSIPEENPAEGEPAPGDNNNTTTPDAVQTDGQQMPDGVQTGAPQIADDVQTGEQQTPDDAPGAEEDNAEGGLAGEESPGEDSFAETVPESSITPQEDTATLASGAGFGEVDNTDVDINNDGFTIIEETDQPKEQIHGKIDAVLIMIVAGGILCIIAIAALLKRILTYVRA